jgi:hypothetical protein
VPVVVRRTMQDIASRLDEQCTLNRVQGLEIKYAPVVLMYVVEYSMLVLERPHGWVWLATVML